MRYSAVVVASGRGSRASLGYNKVFFTMKDGRTILEAACGPFLKDEDCTEVIIVTNKEEVESVFSHGKVSVVYGGDTRKKSVENGLKEVREDYVFIHDGARPFLSDHLVEELKEEVVKKKAVIPVHPIKETVKEVRDGKIERTLDRNILYLAETPQAFDTSLIKEGFEQVTGDDFTDDASILEALGIEVYTLIHNERNDKLTTAEDFRELL